MYARAPMANGTVNCRTPEEEKSAFAGFPLSRRPEVGPVQPRLRRRAQGKTLRAASARNLQQGQAAPVADPKRSAPAAARPRPFAHLRG